ncbi:hypothetical protein [Promicromonospora kroppenstedtii]|uniref:hypothetical protein n=1 Tax=Promicromonospora kroppenstedtii TaxID=440482 RepID=UPI0004B40748|nr:hypothetical protein [Promicromonospora kroppenstedtii]
MNAEELEALPALSVVTDCDGDVWVKDLAREWVLAGDVTYDGIDTPSGVVAGYGPHILLVPATDSGAERLAALRKAVTG